MKRILSLVFVFLLVSSSLSVAQITPPAVRTNELGENVFGEQETGESILLEAYEYEPKQVPSGVLEEQPVPVYVFLKATTLGGLIAGEESPGSAPFYGLPEIKLVSNPVVIGGDRRFVAGVTFVPSNRGRRTLVDETGRFIDLGYLIVRLNKIDKESDLPGFREGSFDVDAANVSDAEKTSFLQTGGGRIDLNVSLDLRFAFENSLGGFGSADMLLGEQANEAEWKRGVTLADSFWNGKGYVRASRIDEKSVNLVVYDSRLRQIRSVTLTEGGESSPIALYLYPFTLVDRFRIQLQKIDVAADKARFLVNDNVVLRGKGERIVAGSDWIVDKIVRVKQLDGGISVEGGSLRHTKTGEIKNFQRRYLGTGVETAYQEFLPGGGKAVPTTTTTTLAPPAAARVQTGDVSGEYADLINRYARLNNLEPAFVKAMIDIESGFNFKDVSRKKDGSLCGAVGLMQLISGTAATNGKFQKEQFFEQALDGGCNAGRAGRLLNSIKGVTDEELKKGLIDIRFNPEENIKAGAAYLGSLYGFYQSKASQQEDAVKLTVAAYNAGEAAINRKCKDGGFTYAVCESILVDETKEHVVKFIPVYENYKREARVSSQPIASVGVGGAPAEVEDAALKNDCSNFKDFGNEKLDATKSAGELHCKAIKELEKTLTLMDDENVRGEAYYWIGENYYALGNYQLALSAYEKVTGLYGVRAGSRMVDASERLKGKVLEETKAYLEEEGLEVAFLGIRELQSQEGPAVYIRVNKGEAKKFVLDDVLPTGNLNDGKPYQLKVDSIDRAQVTLRKVYEDKSLGGQIVVKEGQQRVINEGVQVTLDVVDIESRDNALITILPGSGRAVSRSFVQVHIPVEQRAIQFSGKQIDWQINKTQALIAKMDTTIARMNTWLQRWKLACFGVYGFLTLKNFLKGGDDVKAREIVYRGMENGKGIDDLICNEGNIGYNKKYQSVDECRLKNRKVLEGFVEATKGKLSGIEDFNKELNLLTRDGKKLSQLDDAALRQQVYNKIVTDEKQLSYLQFKTLVENNAITKEEILQAYKSQELNAAYSGKRSELLGVGVSDEKVGEVLKQQEQAYSAQLGKLRDAALGYEKLGKTIKDNPTISPDVIRLMVADAKEREKIKVPVEDYRVYKEVVGGKGKYYGYESGKPIELEPRKDEQGRIIAGAFSVKDKVAMKEENWRTAAGGAFEFGKIQTIFSRDKTIRVDQNGRVTRMPWEKGQYIEVLEWYQNGDPKMMRVVAYQDNGGVIEEKIVHHQSEVEVNPVLKRGIELQLRKKPFCKPGETYSVEGVVFTCNQQLAREEARGLECQDVWPAADCAIMFNVCDPVICPASRFDLGGRWKLPPGRSVVDTGVIGALTLGMPNFVGFGGENVIPPVCGPGVLAGLESWRSMLQAYNQCMIASKTSGKTVGICDAIRSVYVCEIVWREAKSFGGLVGGLVIPAKTRGGGEYTDFQRSLIAIGDSARYFTQEYGRSSFAAFKSRSLDEAGTEFCKAAYFGKAPGFGELLNKLAQPESPAQFTAWFDAFEWTGEAGRTALNPGLSLQPAAEQNRYAVYYHIYAGHDREVRYSVWLQDRSGSMRVPVTNALGGITREVIQKGGYADKQVEIIAGKGLEQVCVEINAAVYCGFGKVATGFLQNYVNDVLVKNELGKEITNEKDCVGDDSLGPSVAGVALPTQAGFGSNAVRRICSLKDPDEGSNKDRWKVVGSCGKGKNPEGQVVDYGSCWVDTASLNLQFRNLDDAAKARLGELGKLYPDAIAAEEKLKRERFEPLFKKLEGLFKDIVKVDGSIQLRKKQEVLGRYAAAMDGVSSLIATSTLDEDYQELVENSVDYAGNSSLRIGQLYMALADLKWAVEANEGKGDVRGGVSRASVDTVEGNKIEYVLEGRRIAVFDDASPFSFGFRVGDSLHKISGAVNPEKGFVAYELASSLQKFILEKGKSQAFDFNGDGIEDLDVVLVDIKKERGRFVAETKLRSLLENVEGCDFVNPGSFDLKGGGDKIICLIQKDSPDVKPLRIVFVSGVGREEIGFLVLPQALSYRIGENEDEGLTPGQEKEIDFDGFGSKDFKLTLYSVYPGEFTGRYIASVGVKAISAGADQGCTEVREGEWECSFIMDVENNKYTPRGGFGVGDLQIRLESISESGNLNRAAGPLSGGTIFDFQISFFKDGKKLTCSTPWYWLNSEELKGGFIYDGSKITSKDKSFSCSNLGIRLDLVNYEKSPGTAVLKFKLFKEINQILDALKIDALKKEALQTLGLSEKDKQRIYSAQGTKELAKTLHDVVWGGTIDSDRNAAINLLLIAEKADSGNAAVPFRIGYYLSLDGRYADALPYFEKAVRLNPDENTYREYLQITKSRAVSGIVSNERTLDVLKPEAKKIRGLTDEEKKQIDGAGDKEKLAVVLEHHSIWANGIEIPSKLELLKLAAEADQSNADVQISIWSYYVTYEINYGEALKYAEKADKLNHAELFRRFDNSIRAIIIYTEINNQVYKNSLVEFFGFAVSQKPGNPLWELYLDKAKAAFAASKQE